MSLNEQLLDDLVEQLVISPKMVFKVIDKLAENPLPLGENEFSANEYIAYWLKSIRDNAMKELDILAELEGFDKFSYIHNNDYQLNDLILLSSSNDIADKETVYKYSVGLYQIIGRVNRTNPSGRIDGLYKLKSIPFSSNKYNWRILDFNKDMSETNIFRLSSGKWLCSSINADYIHVARKLNI